MSGRRVSFSVAVAALVLTAGPLRAQAYRGAVTALTGSAAYTNLASGSGANVLLSSGWFGMLQGEGWLGRVGLRLNGGLSHPPLADDSLTSFRLMTGDLDLMVRLRRPYANLFFQPYAVLGLGAVHYDLNTNATLVEGQAYGPNPTTRTSVAAGLGTDLGSGPVALRLEMLDIIGLQSPLNRVGGAAFGPVQHFVVTLGLSLRFGRIVGTPNKPSASPRIAVEQPASPPATPAPAPAPTQPAPAQPQPKPWPAPPRVQPRRPPAHPAPAPQEPSPTPAQPEPGPTQPAPAPANPTPTPVAPPATLPPKVGSNPTAPAEPTPMPTPSEPGPGTPRPTQPAPTPPDTTTPAPPDTTQPAPSDTTQPAPPDTTQPAPPDTTTPTPPAPPPPPASPVHGRLFTVLVTWNPASAPDVNQASALSAAMLGVGVPVWPMPDSVAGPRHVARARVGALRNDEDGKTLGAYLQGTYGFPFDVIHIDKSQNVPAAEVHASEDFVAGLSKPKGKDKPGGKPS
ncbi:MAG: hypothetical protein P8099_09885 [Gemmatimonadota bacterium]